MENHYDKLLANPGDFKILCIDTETDLAHTTMWMCYAGWVGQTPKEISSPALCAMVDAADYVAAHSLVGFDKGIVEIFMEVEIPEEKWLDTLLLSRLYDPSINGGHSLDAWGKRLGYEKKHFPTKDFDRGDEPAILAKMHEYCQRDVLVLQKLVVDLLERLKKSGFSGESLLLEHGVAEIIRKQCKTGFVLDLAGATDLWMELGAKMNGIAKDLQAQYEPIVTERISEKTGAVLKPDVEVFNLGSRQQVAKRLLMDGVKLTAKTEKGAWKIDETVLGKLTHPAAQKVADYLTLQKRVGMLDSWIKKCDVDDHRCRCKVNTNGAISGRMTHSDFNVAQVPSKRKPYGEQMRGLFGVERGKVLVGIDAAQLELRVLAHYMQDQDYIEQIRSGDIHSYNQQLAGLETRDQAKTFIYAMIYGSGMQGLGEIAGYGAKVGKELKERFEKELPAFPALRDKVARICKQGSIKGIDGRRLRIRSPHSALNFLLQGGGAIIMKRGMLYLEDDLLERNMNADFLANVHDEWQMETTVAACHRTGRLACKAIEKAGVYYDMRCPMAGDYNVGKTWVETH